MNLKRLLIGTAVLSGFLLSAQEEVYKRGDYSTPHTKWFSPSGLAQKPRVLIFSNLKAGRYPAELAERFDLEYECVYTRARGNTEDTVAISGGEAYIPRMEDLLRQKWDAFVFFDGTPTRLLEKYPKLYSILLFQIVRDGAGIVQIDHPDDKVFKEKNLLSAPASILPESPMKARYYKIGNGLGVFLEGFDFTAPENAKTYGYFRGGQYAKIAKETGKYPLVIDYREGWRDEYDALFRKIGENLFWTMKKPFPVLDMAVSEGKVFLKGNWGDNSTLELFAAGGGEHHTLLKNETLLPGKSITAKLPDFVPGTYTVNAIVRSGGKGNTFAARTLTVPKSSAGVLQSISFDEGKYAGYPGTKIQGSVAVTGGDKVVLRLRDPQRRILAEKTLELQSGKAPFAFTIEEWMPSLITVEASLFSGKKEIDRTYEYCNRTIARPGKFEFSMWGHPYITNGVQDINRRLAELGANSVMMPGYGMKHSPYGFQGFPIISNHLYDTIPGKNEKYCFHSEARKQSLLDRFKNWEPIYKTGIRLISLGDEVCEHYGCLTPRCLLEYREYVKKKYNGNLNALNQSWKTSFKSWDEVGLSMIPEKNGGQDLTRYLQEFMGTAWRAHEQHLFPRYISWKVKDFNEIAPAYQKYPAAKQYLNYVFLDQEAGSFLEGNYARWIDRQDYKNDLFCKTIHFLSDHFRKIDPNILAGVEGTGAIDYITNIDKISRAQPWNGAYADVNNNRINEVIRSITPNSYISNSWVGYSTDPAVLCDRTWNEIMRRPAMIMFYTSMGEPPSYFGILRPDLSLYTPAGILLQQTRKLREGLGTALMSSTTVNDPVAVYYSYPSSFGARILNGPSYDFARNNHDGAINLVISLGLSFEYVTNARIESGETSLAKYKVLLLPNASAVSDKNAGEINEFVRNGGTVIADIRAGIFTDVLNVRKPGAFDNAAGISRNGIQAALKTSLAIPGREDMKLLLEPGVQTSGGKALFVSPEKVPAVIVHPYGKGTFVTLNFSFHELPAFSPEGSELQSKIISFFEKVPPHAKVTDGNGKPVFRLRRVEWKNGDMTILAFKSRPGPAMKCKAALPSARHVFNLNTEKALGKVQTFEFENTPPMPSFFVLSDSALPEIALQSPASARRGETVQVTYHVPQMKGKRPLLLSLEKDRNVYGRKLELCADTLPGKASFRIALNDPAGTYRFVLKDVFTGAVRELPLEVQ